MDRVLYFLAILQSPKIEKDDVINVLKSSWGDLLMPSPEYCFDHTNYYEPEMGKNLKRYFVGINNLDNPHGLPLYKEKAIQMEQKFLNEAGGRTVNIDPGYMDTSKVVLASYKPGGHKIALTEKCYADMVLRFSKGEYQSFDWTFPDFKSGMYFEFLKALRGSYLERLRSS